MPSNVETQTVAFTVFEQLENPVAGQAVRAPKLIDAPLVKMEQSTVQGSDPYAAVAIDQYLGKQNAAR